MKTEIENLFHEIIQDKKELIVEYLMKDVMELSREVIIRMWTEKVTEDGLNN